MEYLQSYSTIATWMIALLCILLVVWDNPRFILAGLCAAYALSAWLVTNSLPPSSGGAKFVAGLVACGIIYLGLSASGWDEELDHDHPIPTGKPFRIGASLLVLLVAIGLTSNVSTLIPELSSNVAQGAMMLLVTGILILGLFDSAFRVGMGLLVMLAGFDILYSSVEPSVAIVALLALVHIGIALVVSYLLLLNPSTIPHKRTGS